MQVDGANALKGMSNHEQMDLMWIQIATGVHNMLVIDHPSKGNKVDERQDPNYLVGASIAPQAQHNKDSRLCNVRLNR